MLPQTIQFRVQLWCSLKHSAQQLTNAIRVNESHMLIKPTYCSAQTGATIARPVLECRCLLSPAGSHNKGRQPACWGINWAALQQQKCQRTLPQREEEDWHMPMSVVAGIRGIRQNAKDNTEASTICCNRQPLRLIGALHMYSTEHNERGQ